jgi:hypothetical protein
MYRHHWLKILKPCGINLGVYILANEVRILVGRDLIGVNGACVCQDNLKGTKCRIKGSATCPTTDANFWIKFLVVVSRRHGVLLKKEMNKM